MKKFVFLILMIQAGMANAQQHPLFKEADLVAGEKLIAENKCNECHIRRVGGDGSTIYNPKGRINSAGALRGMVEYCNTELNLGFFPEDTNSVAAVLNKQHYKFR
jgi:hypothetical protein